MTTDTFAIRLLRAQSAANVDKHKLRLRTGLSEYAIRNLQSSGEANPTMNTLVKLAKALDVSTDYLCGLKEES